MTRLVHVPTCCCWHTRTNAWRLHPRRPHINNHILCAVLCAVLCCRAGAAQRGQGARVPAGQHPRHHHLPRLLSLWRAPAPAVRGLRPRHHTHLQAAGAGQVWDCSQPGPPPPPNPPTHPPAQPPSGDSAAWCGIWIALLCPPSCALCHPDPSLQAPSGSSSQDAAESCDA